MEMIFFLWYSLGITEMKDPDDDRSILLASFGTPFNIPNVHSI